MDEKKKTIVIVSVLVGFIILLLLFCLIQSGSKQKDLVDESSQPTYSGRYTTDYESAFEGEEKKVLFIGSSTCGVCSEFTPYMKYLSEKYHFTYHYIDAATMNTNTLESVLEKVGKSIDEIGTPYIAFIENGKKYEELKGYASESALFTLLQKNGIIEESETYISSTEAASASNEDENQYPNISFIGYDKYKEIYDSNERAIVVLGQTGCGNCTNFKPVLNEVAKEKDLTIYYVNLTDLISDDAYALMSSLTYISSKESFGTPLTMVIENKEAVAANEGYVDKDTLLKFLQENNMIK